MGLCVCVRLYRGCTEAGGGRRGGAAPVDIMLGWGICSPPHPCRQQLAHSLQAAVVKLMHGVCCCTLCCVLLQAGQFIGARADFVPEQICRKLCLLQDQVPPMSAGRAKQVGICAGCV